MTACPPTTHHTCAPPSTTTVLTSSDCGHCCSMRITPRVTSRGEVTPKRGSARFVGDSHVARFPRHRRRWPDRRDRYRRARTRRPNPFCPRGRTVRLANVITHPGAPPQGIRHPGHQRRHRVGQVDRCRPHRPQRHAGGPADLPAGRFCPDNRTTLEACPLRRSRAPPDSREAAPPLRLGHVRRPRISPPVTSSRGGGTRGPTSSRLTGPRGHVRRSRSSTSAWSSPRRARPRQ